MAKKTEPEAQKLWSYMILSDVKLNQEMEVEKDHTDRFKKLRVNKSRLGEPRKIEKMQDISSCRSEGLERGLIVGGMIWGLQRH